MCRPRNGLVAVGRLAHQLPTRPAKDIATSQRSVAVDEVRVEALGDGLNRLLSTRCCVRPNRLTHFRSRSVCQRTELSPPTGHSHLGACELDVVVLNKCVLLSRPGNLETECRGGFCDPLVPLVEFARESLLLIEGKVDLEVIEAIAPILQRPVQRILCRSESLFQDASRVLGLAGLAATLDPLRQPNADAGRDEAGNNSHEEGVPTLETNSVLVVVVIRPTCGRVVAHLPIMARPKVMVQATQRRSRQACERVASSARSSRRSAAQGCVGDRRPMVRGSPAPPGDSTAWTTRSRAAEGADELSRSQDEARSLHAINPRAPASSSATPTARRLRGPPLDRGRPGSRSSCHS